MNVKEKRWGRLVRARFFGLVLVWFAVCLSWEFQAFGAEGSFSYRFEEDEVLVEAETASTENRVYDAASLFSEEERLRFEEQIRSMRREMNMDVVLVTTADAEGKTAKDYAEGFYIERNFGTGKDYSGVLFLIDMDNREIFIVPVGKMNRFLTDQRWNAILDKAYEEISSGDFAACAQVYLTEVTRYYQEGIPGGQYNYDEQTGEISVYRSITQSEGLLAFFAALLAAGLSCLCITGRYAMKGGGSGRMAYQEDSCFGYSNQEDVLIYKTVTHVIIPKDNGNRTGGGGGSSSAGSTVHTTSGRTMGGGGRKF